MASPAPRPARTLLGGEGPGPARATVAVAAFLGALLAIPARASDPGFSDVDPPRVEAGAFYSGATIHLHGLVHPDSDVLVLLLGGTEPEVFNRRERTWIIWGGVEHVTVTPPSRGKP